MTKTEIINLALSYLGEPPGTDYVTGTTTAERAAAAHYATALGMMLETHPWSFARSTELLPPEQCRIVYTYTNGTKKTVTLSIDTFNEDETTYIGSDGVATFNLTKLASSTDATISSTDSTFDATAIDADEGLPYKQTWDTFDSGFSSVVTEVYSAFPPWTTTHRLPNTCVRVLRLANTTDTIIERFEIGNNNGLQVLCTDLDEPVQLYFTKYNPADSSFESYMPVSFVQAFALLLAHEMNTAITQNENLGNALLQKHKLTLNQALTKDTRETGSNENMTPRRMAYRSSLYRARFRNHGGPGFDR